MRLATTRRAQQDLDKIWDYVARESGSLEVAERALELIGKTFSLLRRTPLAGRDRGDELRPGLRSIPAGQHVIFYQIRGGTLRIIRVLHGSRDAHAIFFQE